MEVESSTFSEQVTRLQAALGGLSSTRSRPQISTSFSSAEMPPLEDPRKCRKTNKPQPRASQASLVPEDTGKNLSYADLRSACLCDDGTHPLIHRRLKENQSSVSSDKDVEMEDVDQTNHTRQALQKNPGHVLSASSSSLFRTKSQHSLDEGGPSPNARATHPGQFGLFASGCDVTNMCISDDKPMTDGETNGHHLRIW